MASKVLKNVLPNGHQRKPSSKHCDDALSLDRMTVGDDQASNCLKETNGNRKKPSKQQKSSKEVRQDENSRPQTRSKRAASFKSLLDKEKAKSSAKSVDKSDAVVLKKTKSSTSLSALLTRSRSGKGQRGRGEVDTKDKENETPPIAQADPPPIWAQFVTQAVTDPVKIPLNDLATSDRVGGAQSGIQARGQDSGAVPQSNHAGQSWKGRQRLRSEMANSVSLPSLSAGSDPTSQALGRRNAGVPLQHSHDGSNGGKLGRGKASGGVDDKLPALPQPQGENGKRGSRVMAAVAALNHKSKPLPLEPPKRELAQKLDPQAIAAAFETLLDTRNVPQNTRDKMRALDDSIKADLIKKDKAGSRPGTTPASPEPELDNEGSRGRGSASSRHKRDRSRSTTRQNDSGNKARPRSLTFTFSKGDSSPSKKHKSDKHQRAKSSDNGRPTSSQSSSQNNSASAFFLSGKTDKVALPEQFITYLHSVHDPLAVEVSKVHKLQQLLRNEAVSWVDAFVSQRGMDELLGLLYRTMEVEWREEHEDNLMHELLLCLKALSTTSSAMTEISATQSCLFPKLLGMLFDEEKKGPSEYATRIIIMTLISNYLAFSQQSTFADRARAILSYIRDPSPPEDAQPPGFITSIYLPRPFRIWNKELDNLTKEVFWIFLHHTNIIPFPASSRATDPANSTNPSSYLDRHFPREHPPVPAAPYIGGVEWDATNYVTAHLDLLNGLLASLPTADDRNAVRQQLKDSGFEKIMGGYLRTCKEKFYGSVHEALSVWVGAAQEDAWPFRDVKEGPPREVVSPRKAPSTAGGVGGGGGGGGGKKKKGDEAPRLEMPKLDLDGNGGGDVSHEVGKRDGEAEGWF